jgi:hypothetical protein
LTVDITQYSVESVNGGFETGVAVLGERLLVEVVVFLLQ